MVEVHFHDSEFTLFGKTVGGEADDETEPTGAGPPEEPDRGTGAVGALIALAVLVAIAFAVRRTLGGGDGGDGEAAVPEMDVESGV